MTTIRLPDCCAAAIFVILMSLLLSGCASAPDLPRYWPTGPQKPEPREVLPPPDPGRIGDPAWWI